MDSSLAALRIRVFIVSNVRLLREGLATLLRECPSIEVLGAVSVQDTQSALTMTTDLALVDSLSPGESEIVMSARVMPLRNLCTRMPTLPSAFLGPASPTGRRRQSPTP